MKCPTCVELGLRSRVTPGAGQRTLMYCPPFYDEDGVLHSHDANTTTTPYSCSNGHQWVETSKPSCRACDWPAETEEARAV